ncbi:MAG TPA: FAD-binding oxidoreductase, partial [Bauldia sp.]|nr:FAD-binding oxidoreductase [Bauldia sp.]
TQVAATAGGPTTAAETVVFCPGYEPPEFIRPREARIVSTYAFATRPQPRRLWPTRCLLWEASDPYLYVRETPDGRVICGGEDEDFADDDARDALLARKVQTLSRKLGRLLPSVDPTPEFSWAGSFGDTETGLPLIGRVPRRRNCYAVLGFGGNGTTYSRIAADIVGSALDGVTDSDADLFAF